MVRKGDTVKITWEDHWEITNKSMTLDKIKKECCKPYIGVATGEVVFQNKKVVVLASNHWPEDGHYDGSIFIILKKCITKVRHLNG